MHLRKRGAEGKQLLERQSWRRRFGACFTLTMPGSSRKRLTAEEDDGGDRGRVRGIGLTVSEDKTEIMCLRTEGIRSPPPHSA